MAIERTDLGPGGNSPGPVDDRTYNILQALTSTLETLDAYEVYAAEDDDGLFASLLESQRQNADQLIAALRERLGGARA